MAESVEARNHLVDDPMKMPSTYPHSVVEPIECHETHISRVYLAGEFAYKLKKSVKTDFLDYSTLEARRIACESELRQGHRFAGPLYIDVVGLRWREGTGWQLGDAAHTDVMEFAVRMHRFRQEDLLSQRLLSGEIQIDDIDAIAECIATFHDQTPADTRRVDRYLEITKCLADENLVALEQTPSSSSHDGIREVKAWSDRWWDEGESILHQRWVEGCVRECHGDLHCNNVVYWKNRWMPFDGIEFNPNLSHIDVCNDVAFLVMDLQARGEIAAANQFVNAYLEHRDDYGALLVLPWFQVYRALVRAKVASLRERQLAKGSDGFRDCVAEKERYLHLAYRETLPPNSPTLWITHGLSGSGKSTVALDWVRTHGAIRLRSDRERIRLELQGKYGATDTDAVYRHLLQRARGVLASGYSVVVDATFLQRSHRRWFMELAMEGAWGLKILDCDAPIDVLRARIETRQSQGRDPSEATLEVLRSQSEHRDPLDDAEQAKAVRCGHTS